MKLRKRGRIPVEFPASLSALTFRSTGIISNISLTGCRVESQMAVKKDDHLALLVELRGHEKPLYVTQAAIKWVNNEEFGLEFIQMELNERQRLYEIVEKFRGRRKTK